MQKVLVLNCINSFFLKKYSLTGSAKYPDFEDEMIALIITTKNAYEVVLQYH